MEIERHSLNANDSKNDLQMRVSLLLPSLPTCRQFVKRGIKWFFLLALILFTTFSVEILGLIGLIALFEDTVSQTNTISLNELTESPYCEIPIASDFALLLKNPKTKVCPYELPFSTSAKIQYFQGGFMFLPDDNRSNKIYVIYRKGTWVSFPVTIRQDFSSVTLDPPPGLYPVRNEFGSLWLNILGGADSELGWAVEPELIIDGVIVQQVDIGELMFVYPGGMPYLLGEHGKWYE